MNIQKLLKMWTEEIHILKTKIEKRKVIVVNKQEKENNTRINR